MCRLRLHTLPGCRNRHAAIFRRRCLDVYYDANIRIGDPNFQCARPRAIDSIILVSRAEPNLQPLPPTMGSTIPPSPGRNGGNPRSQKRLQDAGTFWGLLSRFHSVANHPTRPLGDNYLEPTDTVPQTPIRATCDGCQTRWRAAARENVGNISDMRGEDRRNTWE